MRPPFALLVPVLALAATSCASGAMPRADVGTAADGREIFGDLQRLEFSKTTQVELPAKLGVVEILSAWDDQEGSEQRQRQISLMRALEDDRDAYSDVVSLHPHHPNTHGGEDSLETIRSEAASHQADLVVAFTHTETVREGHNAAAIFKILLLPMLFLPTEEDEIEVDVRAVVMDTRNGLLYTTFDDRREATVTASVAGEKALLRSSLDSLFGDIATRMREELGRKLRDLEAGR